MATALLKEAFRDALEGVGIGEGDFEWVGSLACRMNDCMKACTDGLRPLARKSLNFKPCNRKGEAFPAIIFEVAFANESVDLLEEILEAWTGDATDVRLAVALKIWPQAHKVSFLIKFRDCPCKQVDFQANSMDGAQQNALECPLSWLWDREFIPEGSDQLIVRIPLKKVYRALLIIKRTPSR
jgi:hypothetical protein